MCAHTSHMYSLHTHLLPEKPRQHTRFNIHVVFRHSHSFHRHQVSLPLSCTHTHTHCHTISPLHTYMLLAPIFSTISLQHTFFTWLHPDANSCHMFACLCIFACPATHVPTYSPSWHQQRPLVVSHIHRNRPTKLRQPGWPGGRLQQPCLCMYSCLGSLVSSTPLVSIKGGLLNGRRVLKTCSLPIIYL